MRFNLNLALSRNRVPTKFVFTIPKYHIYEKKEHEDCFGIFLQQIKKDDLKHKYGK